LRDDESDNAAKKEHFHSEASHFIALWSGSTYSPCSRPATEEYIFRIQQTGCVALNSPYTFTRKTLFNSLALNANEEKYYFA